MTICQPFTYRFFFFYVSFCLLLKNSYGDVKMQCFIRKLSSNEKKQKKKTQKRKPYTWENKIGTLNHIIFSYIDEFIINFAFSY